LLALLLVHTVRLRICKINSFVLETDVVIIGGPRNGLVRHRREGGERAKVTQRTETARRSRHDGPSDD
jgi:hypothetical protein